MIEYVPPEDLKGEISEEDGSLEALAKDIQVEDPYDKIEVVYSDGSSAEKLMPLSRFLREVEAMKQQKAELEGTLDKISTLR